MWAKLGPRAQFGLTVNSIFEAGFKELTAKIVNRSLMRTPN